VAAPPVALRAADPQAPPPDLTHTDLRSVSPLHVRYLQNMGVGASFSLAITLRGALWGLVACHHRSPREIRPAVRRSCREVADAFALGIMGHSSMSRMRLIDQAEHRVDGVLPALGHGLPGPEVLAARAPDIQALVGATGVAILLDPERVAHGRVPPPEALAAIDAWFLSQREDLVATDHLESRLPAAAAWHDSASGLLAMRVRIAHSHASDWLRIYWMRPEVPRTVHWAGRPEKSMVRVGGRDMLNPRKSFEAWTEVPRGRSEPWAQAEQILAMRLRARLLARSRGG
jgi:light-regulated signal transduction histidine kinase (bacteriophytochrome)